MIKKVNTCKCNEEQGLNQTHHFACYELTSQTEYVMAQKFPEPHKANLSGITIGIIPKNGIIWL